MIKDHLLQYHIQCRPGDTGEYCLLPGDPGRCEKIAALFDEPRHLVFNREYNIYTGKLSGVPVSVCSTGIGGPSAAIAVEELVACGTKTFIRIGTCGGIALPVCSGDTVIASGAIRLDGTSKEYAPVEFPAVPDYQVLSAIVEAAEKNKARYHVGVVQCKDSFYGQHSPERMPIAGELLAKRGSAWACWPARWNRPRFSRFVRRLAHVPVRCFMWCGIRSARKKAWTAPTKNRTMWTRRFSWPWKRFAF